MTLGPVFTGLSARMRARLGMAVDPLLGRQLSTMLPSPAHDGVCVDLWIQPLRDGRVQVDAVAPMDSYRLLLKERFTDAGAAIAYWRQAHSDLFGFDPLE